MRLRTTRTVRPKLGLVHPGRAGHFLFHSLFHFLFRSRVDVALKIESALERILKLCQATFFAKSTMRDER